MINEYKEPEDFLMDDTFKQYCEGSSQKCVVFWENWIENHPEKNNVVNKARQLYQILSGNLKPVNEQLAFLDRQISSEVKVRRIGFTYYGIAAAIFIAVLFGILYFNSAETKKAIYKANDLTTQKGERKKVMLIDSTLVFLNADSKIEIEDGFNKSHRRVKLTGEAFFDVKHNKEKPFFISTKNFNITVLGTAFNVKSYDGEKGAEVALLRGIIKLEDHSQNKNQVILKRGQKVIYHSPEPILTATKTDPGEKLPKIEIGSLTVVNKEVVESAWTDNNLIFSENSFLEVKPILERWFNIRIEFKDKEVGKYIYTANFKNEDVLAVLHNLQKVKYFNFKKKGDQVFITK
ncbi:FecR family protein [Pedobacter nyackensis]|uniref:FecR family protein n=1 Tax=Pedobacter nyackensis TaxID=475255 RepID=UPI00292D35CE|nr:FecR domain-containing protein [Pedobacter nyackensis]